MDKPGRVFLVVAGVALALLAMAFICHHSRTRNALQQYKAELRAKGEKLSFDELMLSWPSNANDSTAALTNAVGRLVRGSVDPGSLEVRKYVGPGRARVLRMEDSPVGVSLKGGSSPSVWHAVAA